MVCCILKSTEVNEAVRVGKDSHVSLQKKLLKVYISGTLVACKRDNALKKSPSVTVTREGWDTFLAKSPKAIAAGREVRSDVDKIIIRSNWDRRIHYRVETKSPKKTEPRECSGFIKPPRNISQ
jgi:hypothetical protein